MIFLSSGWVCATKLCHAVDGAGLTFSVETPPLIGCQVGILRGVRVVVRAVRFLPVDGRLRAALAAFDPLIPAGPAP
jgi:hypothetical protein